MSKFPFGKYKGEDIYDIPLNYLKWIEENLKLDPLLRHAVNHEIERRTGDRSSLGYIKPPDIKIK